MLARTLIGRRLLRLARRLDQTHPGALRVVGIDGDNTGEGDDQFCAALGPFGIVGLARKIFPTEKDTENPKRAVTPRLADYDCPGRIVALRSGRRAALCACYDVFGFHEGPDSSSARTRAIRRLHDGGRVIDTDSPGFTDLRRAALATWQARWRGTEISLALAAVHGFEMSGRDGYGRERAPEHPRLSPSPRSGRRTAAVPRPYRLHRPLVPAEHPSPWQPTGSRTRGSHVSS